MKAIFGTVPLKHIGVIIESETPEEAQRLNDVWFGHSGLMVCERLRDGNIRIVIAPSPEKDSEAKYKVKV